MHELIDSLYLEIFACFAKSWSADLPITEASHCSGQMKGIVHELAYIPSKVIVQLASQCENLYKQACVLTNTETLSLYALLQVPTAWTPLPSHEKDHLGKAHRWGQTLQVASLDRHCSASKEGWTNNHNFAKLLFPLRLLTQMNKGWQSFELCLMTWI